MTPFGIGRDNADDEERPGPPDEPMGPGDVEEPAPGVSGAAGFCLSSSRSRPMPNGAMPQPPIGARGLAPQKSWVPSIPMRWTRTMFRTIDFAVAVPTPTGPPPALYP